MHSVYTCDAQNKCPGVASIRTLYAETCREKKMGEGIYENRQFSFEKTKGVLVELVEQIKDKDFLDVCLCRPCHLLRFMCQALEPNPTLSQKTELNGCFGPFLGFPVGYNPEDAERGYVVTVTCKQKGLSSGTTEGDICKP